MSQPTPTSSAPTPTSSGPSPTAPAGSQPSWAAALGSGVTVTGPAAAVAGHGSPGAAVMGLLDAESTGDVVKSCPYYTPSFQSQCHQLAAEASSSSQSATVRNFRIGYVAIDGDQALVGFTGTVCLSGQCFTNSDPATIFSSGKPFSTLWPAEVAAMNSPKFQYSLANCVKIGSSWYDYPPST